MFNESPEGQTNCHATLADEVLSVLGAHGNWQSSSSLLNQCDLAQDGDQLSDLLTRLVKAGTVQRQHDRLGVVYALPGVAASRFAVGEARGPHSAAELRAGERTVPEARIATVRREHVERLNAETREQMLALFREIPLRPARDFQVALGKSQSQVKDYLHALRREREVECIGKARAARWRWLHAPAPDVVVADAPMPTSRTAAARAALPAARAAVPMVIWPEMRERLRVLLQEQPRWTSKELAARIAKSRNTASDYFAKLEDEGLVKRHGLGMATCFEWVGPQPVPCPTENLQPLNADCAAVECNAEAMFGFWSNGDFEIRIGNQVMVLKGDASRQLISFANRLAVQA